MPTTEKEALHTAARRYCIERRRFWVERYIELRRGGDQPAYGYSTKDYATFPRYRILNGILVKAERVTPKEFATVDDLREYLVLAGRTAEDSFTRSPSNEVAARAIEEEQDFFCAYVERLRVHDLRRRTVALTPRLEPGGSPGVCGLRSTLAGALAKGTHPLITKDLLRPSLSFRRCGSTRSCLRPAYRASSPNIVSRGYINCAKVHQCGKPQ